MSSPSRSIPLQLFLFLSLLSCIAASHAKEHSRTIATSDELNNASIANEMTKVGADGNQNLGGGGGGGGPNGGGGGGGGGGGYGWGWGSTGGGGGGGAGGGGGSGYGNAQGGSGSGFSASIGRSGSRNGNVRGRVRCAGNNNGVQSKPCRRNHHRGNSKPGKEGSNMQGQNQERKPKGSSP